MAKKTKTLQGHYSLIQLKVEMDRDVLNSSPNWNVSLNINKTWIAKFDSAARSSSEG